MVSCPECGDDVSVHENPEEGEILDCPTCGTELEVTSANPLELEVAPELEEDWGE